MDRQISKLGPDLIPNDPHQQTKNGLILAGIISRQNLIIGNSLDNTKGLITRCTVYYSI